MMGAGYAKEDDTLTPSSENAIKASGSLKKVRKSLQTSKSLGYFTKSNTDASDEVPIASDDPASSVSSFKQPDLRSDTNGQTNGSYEESHHNSCQDTIDSPNVTPTDNQECSNSQNVKITELNVDTKMDEQSSQDVEGANVSRIEMSQKMSEIVEETSDSGVAMSYENKDALPETLTKGISKDSSRDSDDRTTTPSNSVDIDEPSTSSVNQTIDPKKSKKKDSRRWKLKKKASIDLDWSVFKFSSSESSSFGSSRKQSVDGDETSPQTSSSSKPSSRSSFDLGKARVALRFTKRSSSDKVFDATSPLEEEPPPEELTNEQKVIIKETLMVMKDNMERVGVVMFINLFETHPDVQEAFVPFRGTETRKLEDSRKLRNHALSVMAFVEKAVGRLDEPDKLLPLLEKCGRNHAGYGPSVHHIDLVGPQFIKAIQPALEGHWNLEVEKAWTLLMENIAFVMKKAMRLGMKHAS